jgi:hypothetical protein
VPPRHTVPQAPQLFGSVCVSTHEVPQRVWFVVQPLTQLAVPPETEHSGRELPHWFPQLPHEVGAASEASHPLASVPSQSP